VKCSRASDQSNTCPAFTSRDDAAASTASHPNVRDDRDTPLLGDETVGNKEVIWVKSEAEYFLGRGWTGKSVKRGHLLEKQFSHMSAVFLRPLALVRHGARVAVRRRSDNSVFPIPNISHSRMTRRALCLAHGCAKKPSRHRARQAWMLR
jgi:hypothetical protein